MSDDLLFQALQSVSSAISSEDYLQVVGAENQQFLQERLDKANFCLSATLGSDRPGKQSRSLYPLVRECIDFAGSGERDLPEVIADACEGGRDPRVIVAEAAANALAAFAVSVQPESSKASADLLEHLSLDLSCLSVHIFNGLCHAAAARRLSPESCHDPMVLALQAICTWGIVAIGRTVGYSGLSARILWEWARRDAAWACTLAKGALLASAPVAAGQSPAVVLPRDLHGLQAAVLAALLGLASPAVAFSGEVEDGGGAIAAKNEDLIRHRVELASAVVTCQLAEVLAASAAQGGCSGAPALAAFLVALLQPELADPCLDLSSSSAAEAASEVLIGAASSTGADTIRQARAASASLGQQLRGSQEALWGALSGALGGQEGSPPSFLADCAALAHHVPPSAQGFDGFCRALGDGSSDTGELSALCLIAANAGLAPGEGVPLAQRLLATPAASRAAIAARWERWRGPARMAVLGQWGQLLEVTWTPPPVVAATQDDEASPPPAPPKPLPGRGSVLQELVSDAPAEFRCGLSGQLMLDPVQTPQGLIFDRAALAGAIGPQSGICPVSREPLSLSQCRRVPALRRRITCWVREHRARCLSGCAR